MKKNYDGTRLISKENEALHSETKTASKKIGALIRSMKFHLSEVALYLYKSTVRPCMEYCCHVWDGAPSCYLELLDKLQKLATDKLAWSESQLKKKVTVISWYTFTFK